jgi:hypothetical protein
LCGVSTGDWRLRANKHRIQQKDCVFVLSRQLTVETQDDAEQDQF